MRFKRKQSGELAVEWTLCSPMIFALSFFALIFTIFVIDYYMVSNIASNVAFEMNMGDTGYKTFSQKSSEACSITTPDYKSGVFFIPVKDGTKTLNYDNNGIYCTTGKNNCFRKTFNYFLKQYIGNVNIPFSTLNRIECKCYYNNIEQVYFDTGSGNTNSGDVVCVKITYKFAGIFPITAYGYSYII